jgi:hypothetical protein
MPIHQHGFVFGKEKLFDSWSNKHVAHHLTQTPKIAQSLVA